MIRRHLIEIIETDTGVQAHIINVRAGKELIIGLVRAGYDSRNEMLGELFSGGVPNIRDCYDSDEWVRDPISDATKARLGL